MRSKMLCALAGLALGFGGPLWAQTGSSDGSLEAAQISEIMVRDVSSLLDQLLGPGMSRAYVNVEGTSTEENKQSEVLTPKSKDSNEAMIPPPPGFPYPFQYLAREQQQSRKLTGFRVQRLRVSILVDNSVPQDKLTSVRKVIEDMLRLEPERGDSLTVVRAELFPAWKTMLISPGVFQSMVGQAALITGLLFICFIAYFLGMGLVRRFGEALATRTSSRTEVVAAPAAAPAPPAGLEHDKSPEAEEAEKDEASITIDVGLENVPRLAHLLKDQSPQNVALVMPHLKPEVRKAYLESAPRDFAADVMLAMAPVRYVEPELLKQLKEELERRVHGVMGGPEQAAEMLRSMGGGERSAMMAKIQERSPEAAAAIRSKILLFEDLERFDARSLSEIVAAVGAESMAAASARSSEGLRQALAAAFPGRAADVYRESLELARGAPNTAREAAARETVLSKVEEMVRSGRARMPGHRSPSAALEGPGAEA